MLLLLLDRRRLGVLEIVAQRGRQEHDHQHERR